MHDILIIGGGLSGLYTGYSILKREPEKKVIVLESNNRIGGRIKTVKDRYMSVESGAGRFHNGNRLLYKLIDDLNLSQSIIPIGSLEYTWDSSIKKVDNFSRLAVFIKRSIKISKKFSKSFLQNQTYYDYMVNVLDKVTADEILNQFGYSSELTHMNAYDAITLMKDHLISDKKFFALKGGLTQIIRGLESKIKEMGGQILTGRHVESIKYQDESQNFHIKCQGIAKTYKSNYCVCAVTASALSKFPIFKPVHEITRLIKELPLCRIYSKFPTKNGSWFSDIPRMTMNNKIRMMIPINPEKGIIMISYTDNKYANYWNRLYKAKGVEGVDREHKKILDKEFNINIPEPVDTKVFYYDKGVAYYSSGFDSTIMLKKIMKPYNNMNLYACGENFSRYNNQWMEGALDTSEFIMNNIKIN